MVCALVSAATAPSPQFAGNHLVHVGADLHHAAADEYRREVAQHLAHVGGRGIQAAAAALRVSASTTGNCTRNCSALPTTEPQAR